MPSSPFLVDSQTSTYEPPPHPPPQVSQKNPEYDYQYFRGAKPDRGGRNGRGRGGHFPNIQ